MNSNKWDKCVDVIHRLSSRVNNEQNQSAIVDNCHTRIPLCIEKSFYQVKSDIGQEYCVEVCGNCSDSIKLSNDFIKNTNINTTKKSIYDMSSINPYRYQFTSPSSKICDNKNEYIDYIVSNVLRQVINHIPFNSLHQLSCDLPQHIENILHYTDMDSDRLIRLLVTEILQCYSTNNGQFTDWYAFANLIKPILSSAKTKDHYTENVRETKHKILSKTKKLSKHKKNSEHVINTHINRPLSTTPVPSRVKKGPSSESIAFDKVVSPSRDTEISSVNRTLSTGVTPQIRSPMNSTTSRSAHSKERFTPIGSKFQFKSKSNQTFVSDKSNKTDHDESLPFREDSINQPTPNESEIQDQKVVSDSHYSVHKSNKNSDQSSPNDCVPTIHHKYKHERTHSHYHPSSHLTTTTKSLDTSLLSHTSVPIKESIQIYKQTSVDGSSIITDKPSAHTAFPQTISLNSTDTGQLKSTDLFKLSASSDNATKYRHQTRNVSSHLSPYNITLLSANNERRISPLMNEVKMYEQSVVDKSQLLSSNDLNKCNLSSSDACIQMTTNSIPLKKKLTRINHYPNMLADFD